MSEPTKEESKDIQEEPADREIVKSRAIVKYSAPKPATFTKLQCNTDLNLPPSNWLSSSADSYGLQRVIYHQKGFSSFRMAHMFPDCVGEVDVVSDAENIKNLLKIPYSKGHVSMMVHRVENSLLLDEFDIYKHLLKTSETGWEWLKKFFFENIGREACEQDKHLYIKSRSQKALKQKSLASKFLYHSLVENEGQEACSTSPLKPLQQANTTLQTPPLPDPTPECPDSHPFEFNRNVVWTFEDIEMLLGTDMPIFGGGTHPCISLRLRDMNKPISVLTGIDYWLDNLMSNVPELVMCYHLNGIVQKYELIKTEDLPRLDNSKFSPKLIRDVAQSILSFLKSNATKAGHTYWLFKGKNEEVVKLYDLTSLCSEEDVLKGQNPFTIPVAMLLYKVARNMKSSKNSRSQLATIRMLLKNTVKLLPEEKYPEIVTSSHYMLSDLYIPAELNPDNPNFEEFEREEDEASIYDDDDYPEGDSFAMLDLQRKEKIRNNYKPPPPIVSSLEERCTQAIGHVASGLNCLQYFSDEQAREKSKENEEEIRMAKPFEPIPMPYKKINEEGADTSESLVQGNKKARKREKKKKAKEEQKMALLLKDSEPKGPAFDPDTISWKDHLKTLLLEKAVLAYITLAEYHITKGRYGDSLRILAIMARCQLALDRTPNGIGTGNLKLSCLLGRAGDACTMIVQRWRNVEIYREQLHNHQDEDVRLLEKLEQDERIYKVNLGDKDVRVVFIHDIRTIEQMLLKAVKCYEMGGQIAPSNSLDIRLANSLNELANHYLNEAKSAKSSQDILDACAKSEPLLIKGLQIFEKVNNDANTALLHSNMGHLHRLMAHAYAPEDRRALTPMERKHYNKSIQSYKKALRVIGERKHHPTIWDAINWELSTALFNMACIMCDFPPAELKRSEAEKQVLEALQLAMDHCDMDENNYKFPLYQYRAAIIHYRIASVWHNHIWTSENDSKYALQLASRHYDKACQLFLQAGDVIYFLTCQMHRVALVEQLVEETTSTTSKLKHLQACLKIFIEIDVMLKQLIEKNVDMPEVIEDDTDQVKRYNTVHSLLKLMTTRLQNVLKLMVKICIGNKSYSKLADAYKQCYKATFALKNNLDRDSLLNEMHKVLGEIFEQLNGLRN
ncbi:erythroid differentiation-related factor 1 [Anthonomus grandis grandis]|uniref:erythroid differentiation-related factor 1 n=1 Tax=Anthonomus grandis grandis TaxID=2921223 RepID=UPI002165E23F|nr:erythroid differentiation-related factor 1 [Anthonomus grandis grandis]